MVNTARLSASGLPRLAMFSRHSLIDGRGAGHMLPPGDERGHASLGRWPHNVGDQFVAAGLGRALHCDEFVTITREATTEQFEYLNAHCHAIIVVAQNALSPGWFETHLPVEYLRQIRIPMIFLSLGLQFRFGEEIRLTDGDVRSLRHIHERCVTSQVRGHITQELLANYGIHNTRALGCPSLLYPLCREIHIRPPTLDDVAFTITDMGRLPEFHRFQFDLMETLHKKSRRLWLVAQGGEYALQDYLTARDGIHPSVRRDYWLSYENGALRETERTEFTGDLAPGAMMRSYLDPVDIGELEKGVDWYYQDLSPGLLANIKTYGFFSSHLPEYLRFARERTLYAGTRLHGNIMALTQGTPAVFAVHDWRLRDMARFLRLPHIDLQSDRSVVDLAAFDFSGFEALIPQLWDGFAEFFNENGLVHRL